MFKKIVSSVRKRLGKPRSYQGTYKPQEQQGEVCPTHGVVHKNDSGVTHANKPQAQILGRTGQ